MGVLLFTITKLVMTSNLTRIEITKYNYLQAKNLLAMIVNIGVILSSVLFILSFVLKDKQRAKTNSYLVYVQLLCLTGIIVISIVTASFNIKAKIPLNIEKDVVIGISKYNDENKHAWVNLTYSTDYRKMIGDIEIDFHAIGIGESNEYPHYYPLIYQTEQAILKDLEHKKTEVIDLD